MATKVNVLYNSLKEAFIKVTTDGSGSATLTLESLCYRPSTKDVEGEKFLEAFPEENKKFDVSIRTIQWAGKNGACITLKRGDETVYSLMPECGGAMQFTGEMGYNDNSGATSDFEFTAEGGAPMQIWMILRKMNYKSLHRDARDE